jgi:hypothetical protein
MNDLNSGFVECQVDMELAGELSVHDLQFGWVELALSTYGVV